MTPFIENKLLYHEYQPGYRKNNSATLVLKIKDDIDKPMKCIEITFQCFYRF